jgi:uncharacterized protein YndB with AHSA1/START domain
MTDSSSASSLALSRRVFASRSGALALGIGLTAAATGAAGAPMRAAASASGEGISRTHAAIHQEVRFAAAPARLYEILTRAELFDRVVGLSAAMNGAMKAKLGGAPTAIDPTPGGAFSLFGGYVTGRNLVLEPSARIVLAWRAGSWASGAWSIAAFALVASDGGGARLTFDHSGFPDEEAEILARGWRENYWEPMAKVVG